MAAESDTLFERILDLTNRIRLESDSNRMITLNKVLVEMLDLQTRERVRHTVTKAERQTAP
jgi:hypothetical protein